MVRQVKWAEELEQVYFINDVYLAEPVSETPRRRSQLSYAEIRERMEEERKEAFEEERALRLSKMTTQGRDDEEDLSSGYDGRVQLEREYMEADQKVIRLLTMMRAMHQWGI